MTREMTPEDAMEHLWNVACSMTERDTSEEALRVLDETVRAHQDDKATIASLRNKLLWLGGE